MASILLLGVAASISDKSGFEIELTKEKQKQHDWQEIKKRTSKKIGSPTITKEICKQL